MPRLFLVLLVLMITLRPVQTEEFQKVIVLEFYTGPVAAKEWEIAVFRTRKSGYIQSINYMGKEFKRRMENYHYNSMMRKIREFNLLLLPEDNPVTDTSSFYKLYYYNSNIKLKFTLDASVTHYGELFRLEMVIRTIKNYAELYGNE